MSDLDEIALAMPQTTKEVSEDGRPSYLVHGKMYCFLRGRRPDAVDAQTGERLADVLMFRVADLGVKELMLADERGVFFTTPHFNGYPAVLMRIGDLGIVAIPCEVFTEIGLTIKTKSPLKRTFTISLANGYNGYLPTPAHHALGGYETWRARSSYLEVQASEEITRASLFLLDVIESGRDFRYRLVGTTVTDMNDRNVTGTTIRTEYACPVTLRYVDSVLGTVVSERRPCFTRGSVFWRPKKDHRSFEAGYFPISGDGTSVDMILAEVRFS